MQAFHLPSLISVTLTLIASVALAASPAGAGQPEAPALACPAVLQQNALRLQDGCKVVVVVNTASFCGFTPQYKGLEALYNKYQGRGLVVLGFPSNDFSQESGSNKDIAEFCESTFGVKFPMFTKTAVSGKDASPLFQQLTAASSTPVRWNFYKYIVSRDGLAVTAFNSMADPGSPKFIAEIEKQLARP